jgi:phosphate transport system substrate-binding protein
MNRRSVLRNTGYLAAGLATSAFEWPWPFSRSLQQSSLLIAGTGNLSAFLQQVTKAFGKAHPSTDISIETGGTPSSLLALRRGAIDVAVIARDLTTTEDTIDLHSRLFAFDALAVMVNPQLPVGDVSLTMLRGIFSGSVVNWREAGGPDAPIVVYHRRIGAYQRDAFQELLMPGVDFAANARRAQTFDELQKRVAADRHAISYAPARMVQSAKPLAIDGTALDTVNILLGSYPLTRPFFVVVQGDPSPLIESFVAYIGSGEAQKLLAEHGLWRVG